ncbi:MAG: response regulator [Chloroflexaceae bacterium]|jgi:two-component system KDP operon response regulator KdpE|nr:response regulator [Chloroflexaceae bacterium]
MTDSSPLILIIEDEPQIRRFLRAALHSHGYRLVEAETATDGLRAVTTHPPDLIVLDLGLPDLDGLEVTRRVREWSRVPIIVLSARGQEQDKIAALDAGADDYLTKPFGVGELMARMRVALRHSAQLNQDGNEPVFQVGELRVDLARRQVWLAEQEVRLTPNEYKLLIVLVQHAGKVVTHRQLLREVWGPGYTSESQYLRVYVGNLRHKLECNPARPRYLLTEPGVGYRLVDE